MDQEEEESKEFRSKARTELTTKTTEFNGIRVQRTENGTIKMDQVDKISKIYITEMQVQFASQRVLAQYDGGNSRPEICAAMQLLAPGGANLLPRRNLNRFRKL